MSPDQVPEGPLLVDTDVVSALMFQKGRVTEFAALLEGHVLVIGFPTYGEVLALGHKRGLGIRNMDALRSALSRYVVLPYTRDVVEAWAPLHAKLAGHLAAKGTNDLWIASCALTADPALPLVTNNLGDFQIIARERPDLRLIHPDL